MSGNDVKWIMELSRTMAVDYDGNKLSERIGKFDKDVFRIVSYICDRLNWKCKMNDRTRYDNQKCLLIVLKIIFIIGLTISMIPSAVSAQQFAGIYQNGSFLEVNIYNYDATLSNPASLHTGNLPVPPPPNLLEEIFNGIPFNRSLSIGSKSIINDAVRLDGDSSIIYNFDPQKKLKVSNIYFMINAINAYNVIKNSPYTTKDVVFGKVKIFFEDNPAPYEQELKVGNNIRSWWKGKKISGWSNIFDYDRDLTQVFATTSPETEKAWISDSGEHAADILNIVLPREYWNMPINKIVIESTNMKIIPDGSTAAVYAGLRVMGITVKNICYAPIHYSTSTQEFVMEDDCTIKTSGLESAYGPRNVADSKFHSGIDIPVGENTPIYAIADGIVTFAGGDYGTVQIQHDGYVTRYLHLNSWEVDTSDTKKNVHAGQQIGLSGGRGPTGSDYYPHHLHFDLGYQKYANPLSRLKHTDSDSFNFLINSCTNDVLLNIQDKVDDNINSNPNEKDFPIAKEAIINFGVTTGLDKDLNGIGVKVYDDNEILEDKFELNYDDVKAIDQGSGLTELNSGDDFHRFFRIYNGATSNIVPGVDCQHIRDDTNTYYPFYIVPGYTEKNIEKNDYFFYIWNTTAYNEDTGYHIVEVTASDIEGPKLNKKIKIGAELFSADTIKNIALDSSVDYQIKITNHDYKMGSISLKIKEDNIPPGWDAYFTNNGLKEITINNIDPANPVDINIRVKAPSFGFFGETAFIKVVATFERIPDIKDLIVLTTRMTSPLTFQSDCPIDLKVIDPNGLSIGKNLNEISDANYTEIDLDSDNDPDDKIVIDDRKIGNYQISVIPESRALPNDTYNLKVMYDGITIFLAENTSISSIPTKPYVVKSVNFSRSQSNQPPTANTNDIYVGLERKPIIFDGSNSSDPDGIIVSYTWDFGDGSTGTGVNPEHIFSHNGTFIVNLKVTDNDGATDIKNTTAHIMNTLSDITKNETELVSIIPFLFYAGPLTFTFSQPLNSSGMWQTTYEDAGEYTARVTVSDGFSNVSQDVNITVLNVNRPPMLSPIGKLNATAGSYFSYNVIASDPDNDQLTYSDDSPMFDINPFTGEIGFVPRGNQSFNITVSDGTENVSEKGSLAVRSTNSPPEMEFIFPKTALVGSNFTLLVNASDPDGDNLTYADDTELFDINATTGMIEFTPGSGQIGTYFINITVTDGIETDEAVLNLVVRPDRPLRLEPVQDIVAYVGDLVRIVANTTYW